MILRRLGTFPFLSLVALALAASVAGCSSDDDDLHCDDGAECFRETDGGLVDAAPDAAPAACAEGNPCSAGINCQQVALTPGPLKTCQCTDGFYASCQ